MTGKKCKLHHAHPLQIIFIRMYVFSRAMRIFHTLYYPSKFEQATGRTAASIKLAAWYVIPCQNTCGFSGQTSQARSELIISTLLTYTSAYTYYDQFGKVSFSTVSVRCYMYIIMIFTLQPFWKKLFRKRKSVVTSGARSPARVYGSELKIRRLRPLGHRG